MKTKMKKIFTSINPILALLLILSLIVGATIGIFIGSLFVDINNHNDEIVNNEIVKIETDFMNVIWEISLRGNTDVDAKTQECNFTLEYIETEVYNSTTEQVKKSKIFHVYVSDWISLYKVTFTVYPGCLIEYDGILYMYILNFEGDFGSHFSAELTFWKSVEVIK